MTSAKRLLAAALLCTSGIAQAEWNLNNQASNLNAISVKKTSIAEVHQFKKLSGNITNAGKLTVSIDLASIESFIPIRNQRLREILFETAQYPSATVTGQLDMQAVNKLEAGERLSLDAPFVLSLHGETQTATAKVLVQRLANGSLQLLTREPIILKASDFKLLAGIKQLQEIAKLSTIATAIPVNAQVVFDEQH